VAKIVDPMIVATIGNNDMEIIEQLHASIYVAQVASNSLQGEDVFAMDVERVEARLGKLKEQYEYEEEANDQCNVHYNGFCMQYLVSFCHTWLCNKHNFSTLNVCLNFIHGQNP
jgi:hypothetical protein